MQHQTLTTTGQVMAEPTIDIRLDRIEQLLRGHIDDSEQWRRETETRLDSMAGELAANTEVTADVRSAVTAGKVATKVIKWAGAVAFAGSAIYAAVYTATHHGIPPGGVGPMP